MEVGRAMLVPNWRGTPNQFAVPFSGFRRAGLPQLAYIDRLELPIQDLHLNCPLSLLITFTSRGSTVGLGFGSGCPFERKNISTVIRSRCPPPFTTTRAGSRLCRRSRYSLMHLTLESTSPGAPRARRRRKRTTRRPPPPSNGARTSLVSADSARRKGS